MLATIAELVARAESALGVHGLPLGVGIPGCLSPASGVVKGANTTVLNGRPLDRDLARVLHRPVRIENDANCLAVSEAVDGAGQGARMVFAAILGTGVGAGIAIDGRAWAGAHGIAGEWGHNPAPRLPEDRGVPHTALLVRPRHVQRNAAQRARLRRRPPAPRRRRPRRTQHRRRPHARATPRRRPASTRYIDRLAGALAQVINLLDPNVIVLGGGLSNITELFEAVPAHWPRHVFSDVINTPLRPRCTAIRRVCAARPGCGASVNLRQERMAVREILKMGDARLLRVAEPVRAFDTPRAARLDRRHVRHHGSRQRRRPGRAADRREPASGDLRFLERTRATPMRRRCRARCCSTR